ncbi:UDP-N-acetyl-D-glucosamine dehydrogenase, partial [candidate division WOR-3 bacterium]|nr:UDP-N-acetyl-D-glucosamine dehydrogenase [candidate division WOR-3 bacterium]
MKGNPSMELAVKIEQKNAKVAVIGIGYVGLPLGIEIARAGFVTVGIDVDENKVAAVKAGKSFIGDVRDSDLVEVTSTGKFTATTDFSVLADCDIVNICVPTPFTASKDPDVSYIEDSGRRVATHMRKEQLVVLRSTTYPETTEKVLQPILDSAGKKVGRDYFLSFVPERI